MPVAKPKPSNTIEVVKPDDGNDSLDTIIRQAIGKEPSLTFSRVGESPVHWIQLLHALDQQELPGWPLLTPLKLQMQKCEKCSREFCSPINYRRHLRVHHRFKKLDKDSAKNRDLLGIFWDKLSEDEEKDIVSFNTVDLEDVQASSFVKALTTLIRKPGILALPQVCLRAGSVLLDIVQARPSRFPISSQELFSILDDASEKTFLCGTAVSMQKYVFDGEAGKIGLETKNLVACTSFLIELKLVKAWIADMDAEALRHQKMLVEEEETARRKQAELLERKRLKKLRQKAKDQRQGDKADTKENDSYVSEVHPVADTANLLDISEPYTEIPDAMPADANESSPLEPVKALSTDEVLDFEIQTGIHNYPYNDPASKPNAEQRGGRRDVVVSRRQTAPKLQRGMVNGHHANQSSQTLKPGGMPKHALNRDSRAPPLVYSNRVWSRKSRLESEGKKAETRAQDEALNQPDQSKGHEVLIGSISVTLGTFSSRESENLADVQNGNILEHEIPKKSNIQENFSKPEYLQSGPNRATVKLWRPVSRHGSKGPAHAENSRREMGMDVAAGRSEDANGTLSEGSCQRSSLAYAADNSGSTSSFPVENVHPGSLQINSHDAKSFLGERWKRVIGSEHVTLVLSAENEHLRSTEARDDCQPHSSDSTHQRSILGNAENRLASAGSRRSSSKSKFRTKPEKGVKYIPKNRTVS